MRLAMVKTGPKKYRLSAAAKTDSPFGSGHNVHYEAVKTGSRSVYEPPTRSEAIKTDP